MKQPELGGLKVESILGAIATHEDALDTLGYGSFRAIVRDSRLLWFAIEQEWRPAEPTARWSDGTDNGGTLLWTDP